MSDLNISLMAHNDDEGDWNDLRFKECWHEGYLKGGKAVEQLLAQRIKELEQENASLQAKIDALMLEYCPDEMTAEQIETWKLSQRKVEVLDE